MEYIIYIYLITILIFLIYLIFVLSRDRNSYMKVACDRLLSTIKCMGEDLTDLDMEIERIYIGYSNIIPSVKKVYPNVVVWLEDIVYRINGDFRYARKLKPYIREIKHARDLLCEKYPFSECEKYQQEILGDLKKLEAIRGNSNEDIIIENLITRISGEFYRLNAETKKNNKINYISVFVTIFSIIVTILSFFK